MKEGKCIDCGEEGPDGLSIHGLCAACSHARQMESAKQIRNKSGPYYEKWKARIKASVE